MLSRLMPPMATTGMSAAAVMARMVSRVMGVASALVPVAKAAPMPR